DVEQAHAGLEAQLARDQVELLLLGLLETRVGLREDRARIGHRRTENHLVEAVRHVVVVVDGVGVAGLRVPQPLGDTTPARERLLRWWSRGDQPLDAELPGQRR